MAVAVRYLRSDYALNVDNSNINTVNTLLPLMFLVIINLKKKITVSFNGKWRGGFNISNIGPKVSFN